MDGDGQVDGDNSQVEFWQNIEKKGITDHDSPPSENDGRKIIRGNVMQYCILSKLDKADNSTTLLAGTLHHVILRSDGYITE